MQSLALFLEIFQTVATIRISEMQFYTCLHTNLLTRSPTHLHRDTVSTRIVHCESLETRSHTHTLLMKHLCLFFGVFFGKKAKGPGYTLRFAPRLLPVPCRSLNGRSLTETGRSRQSARRPKRSSWDTRTLVWRKRGKDLREHTSLAAQQRRWGLRKVVSASRVYTIWFPGENT